MINSNEAKLLNEENWVETTKMRKNLQKPSNLQNRIGKAGDNKKMNEKQKETREKDGKEKG